MAAFLRLADISQRGSKHMPILNKYEARHYVCPDWQLGNCLLGNWHCDLCDHCAAHCRCAAKQVVRQSARHINTSYKASLASFSLTIRVSQELDRTVCHKCNRQRTVCQCKRCSACQEVADQCKCMFPSRGGAYGRARYDADMEGIDAQMAAMARLLAAAIITGMEYHKQVTWLERQRKRCAGKLYAIAKMLQDKERDFKGEQAKATRLEAVSPKLLYPAKNTFGANRSTSEVEAIRKASEKGW